MEGDDFWKRIIIGVELWMHYSTFEMKHVFMVIVHCMEEKRERNPIKIQQDSVSKETDGDPFPGCKKFFTDCVHVAVFHYHCRHLFQHPTSPKEHH